MFTWNGQNNTEKNNTAFLPCNSIRPESKRNKVNNDNNNNKNNNDDDDDDDDHDDDDDDDDDDVVSIKIPVFVLPKTH